VRSCPSWVAVLAMSGFGSALRRNSSTSSSRNIGTPWSIAAVGDVVNPPLFIIFDVHRRMISARFTVTNSRSMKKLQLASYLGRDLSSVQDCTVARSAWSTFGPEDRFDADYGRVRDA